MIVGERPTRWNDKFSASSVPNILQNLCPNQQWDLRWLQDAQIIGDLTISSE